MHAYSRNTIVDNLDIMFYNILELKKASKPWFDEKRDGYEYREEAHPLSLENRCIDDDPGLSGRQLLVV
jgi:hypothetical protein